MVKIDKLITKLYSIYLTDYVVIITGNFKLISFCTFNKVLFVCTYMTI